MQILCMYCVLCVLVVRLIGFVFCFVLLLDFHVGHVVIHCLFEYPVPFFVFSVGWFLASDELRHD